MKNPTEQNSHLAIHFNDIHKKLTENYVKLLEIRKNAHLSKSFQEMRYYKQQFEQVKAELKKELELYFQFEKDNELPVDLYCRKLYKALTK